MITLLVSGLTLGFFGSFHCVGMCGPIALALPVGRSKGIRKLTLILLYNLGRMSTYGIFGAFAGALGTGLAIAGYQQSLSIFAGSILLVIVLAGFTGLSSKFTRTTTPGIFYRIRNKLSSLLIKEKNGSLFS